MAADQRLTDTVEKDLANAALILASDIADGSRSRVETHRDPNRKGRTMTQLWALLKKPRTSDKYDVLRHSMSRHPPRSRPRQRIWRAEL